MRGNNPPQGRRTSSKIFSRRNLLASSIGAGSLLLAGCLGDDADDDGADEGDDHADDGDDGEEAPGGDVLMLTTPEGTAGHAMGNGMMSLLTQETNYRGSAQSGTGTQANISQIMTGGADIASGTTPVVHDAYARNPPYDEVDAEHDPLQLWSFYVVLISTMAREGEGYEYVSDLSGDPIAVGPRETSFYPILSEFYQEAIDDYQPVYQAPPDISAELAAGNVSGAICLIAGGQVVSWAHEVVVEKIGRAHV